MQRRSRWVVPSVFVDPYESFTEEVDEADAASPAEAASVVRDRHFPRATVVSRDLIVHKREVVRRLRSADPPTERPDKG